MALQVGVETFKGEFRPGPRPSLASVHTASLAPHGPMGYGSLSGERTHQPWLRAVPETISNDERR